MENLLLLLIFILVSTLTLSGYFILSRRRYQVDLRLRDTAGEGDGPPPGLLAYDDGRPVAWCALAPRETYHALANSRILKPVDDQPVWSVVCFFVAKPYRRRGLSTMLLDEAAKYARKRGARH